MVNILRAHVTTSKAFRVRDSTRVSPGFIVLVSLSTPMVGFLGMSGCGTRREHCRWCLHLGLALYGCCGS